MEISIVMSFFVLSVFRVRLVLSRLTSEEKWCNVVGITYWLQMLPGVQSLIWPFLSCFWSENYSHVNFYQLCNFLRDQTNKCLPDSPPNFCWKSLRVNLWGTLLYRYKVETTIKLDSHTIWQTFGRMSAEIWWTYGRNVDRGVLLPKCRAGSIRLGGAGAPPKMGQTPAGKSSADGGQRFACPNSHLAKKILIMCLDIRLSCRFVGDKITPSQFLCKLPSKVSLAPNTFLRPVNLFHISSAEIQHWGILLSLYSLWSTAMQILN